MTARRYHRLRRPALGAAALLTATSFLWPATGAAANPPPQEPGVTLRVFDLQTPLSELCTLKTGQTPNVDKLMPTIDWSSNSDFGLDDFFAAQALGNVDISQPGEYTFRLISDDGSRLLIDDSMIISHDGVHAATAKDGTVNLTAGYHSLRIDYFERDYGQRLTLQWKPPGASTFTLVPDSVLSTDADVVRVTAPGRKDCEASEDSPGDGLPLTDVHPDFSLTDLRPTGFEPKVTGFDWFPDGRLALSTWAGIHSTQGEVWVLDNVTGNTSPAQVTRDRVATGLKEPMGLKIVDGKIYVSEKHRLTELNDTNGDGVTDDYRTVATWPFGENFHEFAFGLLYRDGYFYLNLSVAINSNGDTTDPQPSTDRGTTVKVNRATGEVSTIAGGLRTPHGIGWGPENGVFVTDNQGGWLPSSKLVHIKQGRFFNHSMNPAGPFDNAPVTAPVLWMPQNEIANSPSTPVVMIQGPFAGQMAIGDVTYGGVQRAYLEKVDGEYQGALFRMTQGLEAGVSELSVGPDGALYVGGIGGGGNWGQNGKLTYGLQKLTPNDAGTFDILAMRAVPGGFEMEYTQPLSTETADSLVTKYRVKQWRYVPTAGYGGPKVDLESLNVTSATLSADGKKVNVQISGLQAGRVVHIRSPKPFSSSSGQSLWSTEAWYTLNSLADAVPPPTDAYEAESAALSGGAHVATDHTGYTGTGFVAGYNAVGASTTFTVDVASAGSYQAGLRFSNGPWPAAGVKTVSLYVNGAKVEQISLASTGSWENWATHSEPVTLTAGSNTIAYKVDSGDSGNVNLDNLTITGDTAGAGQIVGIGGKCLDVDGGRTTDGTKIQLWTCNDSSGQQWSRVGDTFQALGKCLDVSNGGSADGTKVQLWSCTGSENQVWQPQANGSILNPQSGKVLDASNHSSADGTQIHIWQYLAYANQHWVINGGSGSRITLFDGTTAPRFNSAGAKTANARATVVGNGVTVHDNVEIDDSTFGGAPEGPSAGPVRLQDHGDPNDNVRFRNIVIEPVA